MSGVAAAMVTRARLGPISVTAWSAIGYSSPSTSGTNEDRTLTFNGPARTINLTYGAGANTLEYRINSGAWTVGDSLSISSGQTLGFRISGSTPEVTSVDVKDGSRGNEVVRSFAVVVA